MGITNSIAAALRRVRLPRGTHAVPRLSLTELLLAIACLAMAGCAAVILVQL